MEFGRVKTILIAVFLALNVFLAYQWWSLRAASSIIYAEPLSDQLANVQGALAAHGLHLLASVPEVTPRLSVLRVAYDRVPIGAVAQAALGLHKAPSAGTAVFEKGVGWLRVLGPGHYFVRYERAQRISLAGNSSPVAALKNFIESHVYSSASYSFAFAWRSREGLSAIFRQQYGGYPIFSAGVNATADTSGIRYTQTLVQILQTTHRRTVMSAVSALLSLSQYMDKVQLNEDNTIEDVRLGYDASVQTSGNWYLVPVWRVQTRLGVFSINAFTGEVGAGSS